MSGDRRFYDVYSTVHEKFLGRVSVMPGYQIPKDAEDVKFLYAGSE